MHSRLDSGLTIEVGMAEIGSTVDLKDEGWDWSWEFDLLAWDRSFFYKLLEHDDLDEFHSLCSAECDILRWSGMSYHE